MNNIRGHIIRHVFLFSILWSLVSCSSELNDTVVIPDEVELQVRFRMATGGDSPYEEGEMYENYIPVAEDGDYRIYFFDADDKFIARFYPNGMISNAEINYRRYDVTGTVPNSLVRHSHFKVVVIANWPTYLDESEMTAGETTIEDLCTDVKSRFDGFTSFSLGTNQLIPFYGVREFSNIVFKSGAATVLPESVTLLRAVSKVEVVLKSEEGDNLTLNSVQICRYNQRGYCAPNANRRSDYDHDGAWDMGYAESLHLVDGKNDVDEYGNAVDKRLSFREASSWVADDGYEYKKWIAYLTEYQNIGVGEGYCFIEIKFNNQSEDDTPHKIYFARYVDGKTDNADDIRLNVERNNLYRFNVTVTPLQLLVSVEEWVDGGKVHIEM